MLAHPVLRSREVDEKPPVVISTLLIHQCAAIFQKPPVGVYRSTLNNFLEEGKIDQHPLPGCLPDAHSEYGIFTYIDP